MSGERPGRSGSELDSALALLRSASDGAVPVRAGTGAVSKKVRFSTEKEELSKSAIKLRDMTQTSQLRKRLAVFAIVAVSAQLLVANVFFGFYLWQTKDDGFEPSVMIAWLSATVVEVVGIVVIVARNLFPSTAVALRQRDIRRLAKAVQDTR